MSDQERTGSTSDHSGAAGSPAPAVEEPTPEPVGDADRGAAAPPAEEATTERAASEPWRGQAQASYPGPGAAGGPGSPGGVAGSPTVPLPPPGWGGADPLGAPSGGGPAAWAAGPPSRGGRTAVTAIVMVGLMLLSAVGGGVVGATLYGYLSGGSSRGGTTLVVDGPQLEYTSLASIASQVSPSVVSIRVGQFGGSGVVLSDDGYILTNAHVVEPASGTVVVRFHDGRTAQATVVGADRRSDIAVIKVEGVSDLAPATFGDSDKVLVGDTVLAIGSPLGYEGSVTQGIISALDRTVRPEEISGVTLAGLLQTDAAINRGNSGGALVNLAGEVIGINTAIAVESEESGFIGVGFAVPSNRATEIAERLIEGEEISHAYLGVYVAPAEDGGAVISAVTPGSPAEEAGLRPGDVVLRFGDRQISDANDLVSAVQQARVGETVEVEYRRNGIPRTTTVTLAEAVD